MGILDKFKNLFVEEEEPIKSEVIQVEIPSPVKEEKKVEVDVADNTAIKNQEKATTPIFFDDDYFKELEQPKPQPKKEVKSSYLKEPVKKEEKKHFKPTPIISPVYGVLDKNYNKEDITTKKERDLHYTNTDVTIDEVRKKAFGTLEDELENTLFGKNSILFNDEVEDSKDLFDELVENPIDTEEINIVEDEIEVNMVEEEIDKGITESDLFDLIDSMYEKGE